VARLLLHISPGWPEYAHSAEEELMVQVASRPHSNGHSAAGSPDSLPLLETEALPLLTRIATGLREPVRLQLLAALLPGERSVTELTQLLARSQPSVSKHLRVLRDQQLVRTRRDRNRVFYRIASDEAAGQAVTVMVKSLEGSAIEGAGRRRN
jgi:DNA-binding transcriptional ArsR family regulator